MEEPIKRLKKEKTSIEVKQELLNAGWPEDKVNKYLEKTYKKLEKETIIRAINLTKKYDQKTILDGIDFEVKTGEIFGLIGISGAGKTTLLNVLVGFVKPEAGTLQLALPDGTTQNILENPDLIKQHIGFSTQTPSFYPKLTVRENLEHFATLYHIIEPDLTRRCNALMELVGLKEAKNTIASKLSGGMQKRLDIACALLHDPAILILDEPTADLDQILRKQLWELIRQINAKGTTILIASHFLAEIELLCDRIAVLQNKKIEELGTTQQLKDSYSKSYEIHYSNKTKKYDGLIKELQKKHTKITEEQGELVIQTKTPEQALTTITTDAQKQKIEQLSITKPTLGRVFEAIVKR